MGPSTPSAPDDRPDIVSPVYFNAASAQAAAAEATEEEGEVSVAPVDAEERGVRRAQLAALLSVLGIALALLGPFILFIALGLTIPVIGISFGAAALTITLIEGLLGLVVAGVFLEMISFGLYTSSFGLVRHVDSRFRAPRALSVVGVVGFLLVGLAAAALLGEIFQAVECAASGAGTSCIDPTIAQLAAFMFIGGLLLGFVGWIGLLLGLYRFGSRYESTLLKVSAILMIFPLVNLIAPILAFVELRRVPKRFDLSGPTPA